MDADAEEVTRRRRLTLAAHLVEMEPAQWLLTLYVLRGLFVGLAQTVIDDQTAVEQLVAAIDVEIDVVGGDGA